MPTYSDSGIGYTDTTIASAATRYLASDVGFIDATIIALRPVLYWTLRDGVRYPLEVRGRMSSADQRAALVAGEFFPDETTTGHYSPEEDLVEVSADSTFATPGEAVFGKKFLGRVTISASNVTFRDCLFVGPNGPSSIAVVVGVSDTTTGITLTDCTIRPRYCDNNTNAVMVKGVTLVRCNISRAVDAVSVVPYLSGPYSGRTNTRIEGCWLHDTLLFSPDPNHSDNMTHSDVIQWHGGKGLTVRGSRIEGDLSPIVGDAAAPGVGSYPDAWVSGNPYPISSLTGRYRSISILQAAPGDGTHGELIWEWNWFNTALLGLSFGGSPNSFLVDDGSRITDNWIGLDWHYTQQTGTFSVANSFAILPKANHVITIARNKLWNPLDPWDSSVANNTRKNG